MASLAAALIRSRSTKDISWNQQIMIFMAGNPDNGRTKDHYIPAGHLRQFTNEDGLIHTYDLETRAARRPARPESTGFINKWDRFLVDGTPYHVDFRELEQRFFAILNSTLAFGRIPQDVASYNIMLQYVASLYGRSPTVEERIKQNIIHAHRLIDRLDASPDAMRAIEDEHALLSDPNNLHAAWALICREFSQKMLQSLHLRQAMIIQSHNDVPFQLGDAPVVPGFVVRAVPEMVNPYLGQHSAIFMPLTPRYTLALLGQMLLHPFNIIVSELTRNDVLPYTPLDSLRLFQIVAQPHPYVLSRMGSRYINQMQALAAHRCIYSHNGDFSLSAQFLHKNHPNARNLVKTHQDDEDVVRRTRTAIRNLALDN